VLLERPSQEKQYRVERWAYPAHQDVFGIPTFHSWQNQQFPNDLNIIEKAKIHWDLKLTESKWKEDEFKLEPRKRV
jgi:hypothetical protein